jgi:hypothetical protein
MATDTFDRYKPLRTAAANGSNRIGFRHLPLPRIDLLTYSYDLY